MHSWYHLDLDLPGSGIGNYEDSIPLPDDGDDPADSDRNLVLTYFSAMIVLSRLIRRTHRILFDCMYNRRNPSSRALSYSHPCSF